LAVNAATPGALHRSRFTPVFFLRRINKTKEPLHRMQILSHLPVQRIGLLERLNRIVQQFVDDPPGQLLQMLPLRLADLVEFIDGAGDFILQKLACGRVRLEGSAGGDPKTEWPLWRSFFLAWRCPPCISFPR